MNKLHSIALCTLITPVLTFSLGSALANNSNAQNYDRDQRSNQQEISRKNEKQSDSKTAYNRGQSQMQNRGYLDTTPASGMHASNLIGAEIKTTNDEEVGPVSDLIINKDGQIVAIVVGVGGFLGMGEREVAIGWDDVRRSRASDDKEQDLRINATRETLRSAPEYIPLVGTRE